MLRRADSVVVEQSDGDDSHDDEEEEDDNVTPIRRGGGPTSGGGTGTNSSHASTTTVSPGSKSPSRVESVTTVTRLGQPVETAASDSEDHDLDSSDEANERTQIAKPDGTPVMTVHGNFYIQSTVSESVSYLDENGNPISCNVDDGEVEQVIHEYVDEEGNPMSPPVAELVSDSPGEHPAEHSFTINPIPDNLLELNTSSPIISPLFRAGSEELAGAAHNPSSPYIPPAAPVLKKHETGGELSRAVKAVHGAVVAHGDDEEAVDGKDSDREGSSGEDVFVE